MAKQSTWVTTFEGAARSVCLREAPDAGAIRVQDGLPGRPALRTLVAQLGGGARPETIELRTDEGEFGVFVATPSSAAALVFGDSHYAQILAEVRDPGRWPVFREKVRAMAQRHTLGLGAKRCRPYLYDAPLGWTGLRRPRQTLWLAPGYPRPSWSIRVHDAWPLDAGAPPFREAGRDLKGPRARLDIGGGSSALVETSEHPAGIASDATLTDRHYVYRVRLENDETGVAEAGRVLATLLRSVRLLSPHDAQGDVFAAWQE
jgi:hypothetical protein